MSENEIVRVLLFGNKGFTKDTNFRIIASSIRLINIERFDETLSSWEKPFWHIYGAIKVWNMFAPSILMFYVTYLLWRAVKCVVYRCMLW